MDLTSYGVQGKKPQVVNDKKLDLDINQIKKNFESKEVEYYLPWFLKYKVEKFEDLIETKEIKTILKFFNEFKPKTKGLLLVGAAGSGKTTTLNLVAQHYGAELFELNASDSRNKKSIDESVGDVIKQKSLFGREKIVLIDEVDGVSGTQDRGGVAELVKYIKSSNYPLVFTANDKESDKIKALKKACVTVDFENHSFELLKKLGEKILKSEKISFEKKDLEEFISQRSTVDIRGFINDLQASVIDSKFILSDNLELRDYKRKIEGVLNSIYYSYPEDSIDKTFNSDVNIDDLLLYLEENTPLVYSSNAQVFAAQEIAKADVFRGRIIKWQYWRYLVYVNFYLTYGVSSMKDDNVKKVTSYKKNFRILRKWMIGSKFNSLGLRTRLQKEKGEDLKFVERLAKLYGRSATRVRKEDLKYFAIQYEKDKEFREEMKKKLEIDGSVEKSLKELLN